MIDRGYDGSLEGLFAILAGVCRGDPPQDWIHRRPPASPLPGEPELLDPVPEGMPGTRLPGEEAAALAKEFFELSAGAYDSFICGWMSEFPIEAECVRFGGKVIAAARSASGGIPKAAGTGTASPEARRGAERAAADRGDRDVGTVLDAAYKVRHETDRLLGLLRFRPDSRGTYSARCAPDHFVLPRLAGHFSRRFGDTPWLIIDEKRGLCLLGDRRGEPRLVNPAALPREPALWGAGEPGTAPSDPRDLKDPRDPPDPWEALWRTYHGAINNPGRRNPGLQRQFMPRRYWKYLPELGGG
jgi:probable DNA metabolism protein